MVYQARLPDADGPVALKVLDRQLAGDPVATRRFLREARALTRISHPYVVRILDSGVDAGRPFIVMEYLAGETLNLVLARQGRLSLAQLVQLFLPAVTAVAALHDRRIVHRDLKPANFMVTRRREALDELVVLDLGISRLDDRRGETAELTRSEALLGTLPYLSPEQLRNARWAGNLSDQYALGVALYECATGTRPFAGNSHYDLVQAIVTGTAEPPSARVPGLPPAFDALVMRALSRDPERRFPGVAALGSALLACADREGWARWGPELLGVSAPPSGEATVADGVKEMPRGLGRLGRLGRPRGLWATVALVVLVAGGLLAGWRWRRHGQPIPAAASASDTDPRASGDDPRRCGARGLSCEGGRCVAGRCQPVALISPANAPGLFVPRQIAIADGFLYLADYSDFNDSGNPGEIYRVPVGGGPVTVLAEGLEGPFGIASDGQHVYFTNYDGGTVMRVPVAGGPRELLAEDQGHPSYLALDPANAYWTNFYAGADRSTAARTGSVVRWNKKTRRTHVLAADQDFPNGITIDGPTVYWTNYADSQVRGGSIASVAAAGGRVSLLFENEVHPFSLAIAGGTVYWTNLNSALGGVKAAALADRTVRVLNVAHGGSPAIITVHGGELFWTERHTGRVVMQPIAGGAEVTLATDQVEPYGIAVDDTRVFWVMRDGVMKLVR